MGESRIRLGVEERDETLAADMLRELLLDCRNTLRRATFAFHETDLRTRLDAAIQALSGKQSALKVVLRISIHVEATAHLHKDLTMIRALGRKAGVALNPATPIDSLTEVLPELDFVLIMSVNPGWGGQSFIPSCREKIRKLRDRIRAGGLRIPIEVDGGINLGNVEDIIRDGCEVVVAGSAVYDAPDPAEAVRKLQAIARKTS